LAANDLAVLLAEEGRLEQARDCLHAGLRQSPQPAMWNNLAAVHDRLGQPQLALAARQEAAALESRAASTPGSVLPTHNVAWLDPRNFAATSRAPTDVRQATSTIPASAAAPVSKNVPASAQRPVEGWTQRPRSGILAY
jgi:tetratricopeptide (TPR) repeat protein